MMLTRFDPSTVRLTSLRARRELRRSTSGSKYLLLSGPLIATTDLTP